MHYSCLEKIVFTIQAKCQVTKLSSANWDAIIDKMIDNGYMKQENKFEYHDDEDIKC